MTEQQPTTTSEPELRDVRIGSTEHWTLSARDDESGARTLCGMWIAGTPVSPITSDFCEACQQRQGCDECGHGVGTMHSHLWAPAAEEANPEAGRFIYANATCWAEHICRECDPALHAQALALLGLEAAPEGMAH